MTGFLLTAKQKLMLCINKRLYGTERFYRGNRSNRPHRSDGTERRYGSHRAQRRNRNLLLQDTGSAVSLFHTASGGKKRYSADLRPERSVKWFLNHPCAEQRDIYNTADRFLSGLVPRDTGTCKRLYVPVDSLSLSAAAGNTGTGNSGPAYLPHVDRFGKCGLFTDHPGDDSSHYDPGDRTGNGIFLWSRLNVHR